MRRYRKSPADDSLPSTTAAWSLGAGYLVDALNVLFLPRSCVRWYFFSAVEKMKIGHEGMAPDHSGTGVAHYLLGLALHCLFIAMGRAIATGRLLFLVWAMGQSLSGIVEKIGAVLTEPAVIGSRRGMVLATINFHHGRDCFEFSIKAGGKGHGDLLYR